MSKLTFYFDAVSPYSMLMYQSLLRYKREWGSDVECKFRPVLLAGIMHLSKNTPPGANKMKGAYLAKDLKICAEMTGVKMLPMPKNFFQQAQDMRIARLLTSISMSEGDEVLSAAITRAFAAIHATPAHRDADNAITIPQEALLDLCLSSGVTNPQATLESIDTEPVKATLKTSTSDAVAQGMFGAPFVHVKNHVTERTFFGSDRLEHLCHFLEKPYHGLGHKL